MTLEEGTSSRWITHSQISQPGFSFENMLRQGRLDEISAVLEAPQVRDPELMTWLNESCTGRETALHVLARYQANAKLVDLMVRTLKRLQISKASGRESASRSVICIPEDARDDVGRTPLHVAAASGSRVEVIDRLLGGEMLVMSTYTRDKFGRYPLHWACANPSGLPDPSIVDDFPSFPSHKPFRKSSTRRPLLDLPKSESRRAKSRVHNMTFMIQMLISVHPEAVLVRDENGMTPYDLALVSDVDPVILNLLQSAIKLCRRDTTDETAGSTVEEGVPVEVSHHSETLEDYDSDISTIGGYDEDPLLQKQQALKKSLQKRPQCHPSVVVAAEDRESKDVIQKCWFI